MFGFLPGPVACCAKAAATYRAHFCGLCNVLRQDYGLWARWLINRDSTFLAVLGAAQTKDSPKPTLATCCNPWTEPRHLLQGGATVRYAAAVTLCGLSAKLDDDADDERGPRRWLATAGRRVCDESTARAVGLLHALDFPVGKVMQALHAAPRDAQYGTGLHEASAPTRLAYGEIVAHTGVLTGVRASMLPALREIGEQLGFLIYAKDAWDDWEQDRRRRRFNPLHRLIRVEERREFLAPVVTQSLVSLRAAFENLVLHRNRDLLHSTLVEGVDFRIDRWLHIRDAKSGDGGEDRKKRERKCCDRCDPGCDCSGCCDCCDCARQGGSLRCGKPNCHPHCRGGGEMFDCNPCDGDGCDCCACDCGW